MHNIKNNLIFSWINKININYIKFKTFKLTKNK